MATRQIAQGLAGLGRYGDSTLVHMQPEEVAGLQALAKTQGTTLTINPETGLPEAFSLGGFFKSLLPTIAGFAAAGMSGGTMSPMVAGILAGAGTGALTNKKDPLMGAVMGGIGGYGGQSLYGAAMAPTAAAAKSTEAMIKNAGVDPSLIYSGSAVKPSAGIDFSNAVGTPNYNIAPVNATGAGVQLNKGALPGFASDSSLAFNPSVAPGGTMGTKFINPNAGFGSSAATGMDNISQAVGNIANDPLAFAMANKMPIATTLGGAALQGIEPSDIYGEPVVPQKKVIPTLNLSDESYPSLNLNTNYPTYAAGGPVSFADGGDTGKDPAGLPGGGLGSLRGGNTGASQGAGMLPLDVSDINAKYGVEDAGVPAPRLGLFADNDQIEAARNSYETQLKAAMSGRGGMGSPYGFGGMGTMNRGGTDIFGRPTQVRGMGGMQNPNGGQNSMGMMTRTMGGTGIGATAPTATTAETALSRLNLNKNYANGGTIQAGGTQDLYGSQDDAATGPMLSRNGYGLGRLQAMADGGMAYAKGGYLDGAGDGMSDSIPATIEGKQPARLADGEFVIPADVVSHLGNGSTKAGAQRLYGMLDKVRKARTGTKKQGKQIKPEKYMPA